jgi:serine/threonine-protein kinase
LAKDPGARWPTAAAMATVARQAAAALSTTAPQPSAPQPPRSPVSPANGHPQFGPTAPASPVAGNGRVPYPPQMARPVSGARGAASVPSGPPVPPQAYRQPSAPPFGQYQQPTPAARPEGSGGRQVLIVLAVVLALLVLLCAGVISFLVKQQNKGNAALGDTRAHATVVHTGVSDGAPPAASYRLSKKTGTKPGWIRANEGRQTL